MDRNLCIAVLSFFYPWHRLLTPLFSPLYIFLFLNSEEPIKLDISKSTGLLFIYHHLETHSKSAVGFKCPHLRWWKLTLIPSGTCWYKCHENQTMLSRQSHDGYEAITTYTVDINISSWISVDIDGISSLLFSNVHLRG